MIFSVGEHFFKKIAKFYKVPPKVVRDGESESVVSVLEYVIVDMESVVRLISSFGSCCFRAGTIG